MLRTHSRNMAQGIGRLDLNIAAKDLVDHDFQCSSISTKDGDGFAGDNE